GLQPPVDAEDEVAERLLAPQALLALGLALGVVVDDAVDHLPVAVVPLGHLPAGEVLAVEQLDEALRDAAGRRGGRGRPGGRGGQGEPSGARRGEAPCRKRPKRTQGDGY